MPNKTGMDVLRLIEAVRVVGEKLLDLLQKQTVLRPRQLRVGSDKRLRLILSKL